MFIEREHHKAMAFVRHTPSQPQKAISSLHVAKRQNSNPLNIAQILPGMEVGLSLACSLYISFLSTLTLLDMAL
jgi:hypothetical protein